VCTCCVKEFTVPSSDGPSNTRFEEDQGCVCPWSSFFFSFSVA
jgi:hypothetical protein